MQIPVDVTFHPSWWHKNANVAFNRDFFENVDYRLEADVRMRRVLFEKFGDLGLGEEYPKPRPIIGSDLIASGFLHSAILGCQVRYSDENPPEVICMNLDDDGVMNLTTPRLDESPIWRDLQSQIDRLLSEFGYVMPCVNLMGVQNIALDIRGSGLYIDYFENPELARRLLSLCAALSVEIGRRLRSLSKKVSWGVTAITKQTAPDVYLTSNCTVEMVSQDVYEEFLLEYDVILAKEFQPFGIHHCGQTMEHVAEGYKKAGKLAFAEVGAFSDIGYVRKCLPDVYLNARYSPAKLTAVSRGELQSDISQIMEAAKPLNLLSISCVGIDASVSDEKVSDFMKICREFE